VFIVLIIFCSFVIPGFLDLYALSMSLLSSAVSNFSFSRSEGSGYS
jgi:hypothetical protein